MFSFGSAIYIHSTRLMCLRTQWNWMSHVFVGKNERFRVMTYLIEVNHHVPIQPLTTLDIFQCQGEVHPSGVRDIQIVCVVLVPLLNSCKYLILSCADNMHVLFKEEKRPITRTSIFLCPLGHVVITITYGRMEMEHEL